MLTQVCLRVAREGLWLSTLSPYRLRIAEEARRRNLDSMCKDRNAMLESGVSSSQNMIHLYKSISIFIQPIRYLHSKRC